MRPGIGRITIGAAFFSAIIAGSAVGGVMIATANQPSAPAPTTELHSVADEAAVEPTPEPAPSSAPAVEDEAPAPAPAPTTRTVTVVRTAPAQDESASEAADRAEQAANDADAAADRAEKAAAPKPSPTPKPVVHDCKAPAVWDEHGNNGGPGCVILDCPEGQTLGRAYDGRPVCEKPDTAGSTPGGGTTAGGPAPKPTSPAVSNVPADGGAEDGGSIGSDS